MHAIVVHGGAGEWRPEEEAAALAGVGRAARAGLAVLAGGGPALDAVVAAVVVLEDDPLFNAGTGSVLGAEGEAEMDASVMSGHGLRAGGVAAIRRVRNPVQVARRVMEETDHVLLACEGALAFARSLGFPDHDPVTPQRRTEWEAKRRAARLGAGLRQPPDLAGGGTVGAVALDAAGWMAAATSTGGLWLKMPGRVGDSPVPGAGNYATPFAASSATGLGELMLRYLVTRAVCDRVEEGMGAAEAARTVLARMARDGAGDFGLIAIDRAGGIGLVHGTPAMPHAWARSDGSAGAAMRAR